MMQPNRGSENKHWAVGSEKSLRQLDFQQLRDHRLLALAYSRGVFDSLDAAQHEIARQRLLSNIRKQATIELLLEELGCVLRERSLRVGLLKGTALWSELYRPGEREVSDIDLFVDHDQQVALGEALATIGYRPERERNSRLSGFKCVFLNPKQGDLSIEVHTRLWWREPSDFRWSWRDSHRSPFLCLSPEDQFIHLSGHWIAQHTMLSLHWLFDIALYLDLHDHEIDWRSVRARAAKLDLRRSTDAARAIALATSSAEGLASYRDKGIDFEFLLNPKRHRTRYFLAKHRVQDSIAIALQYDWHWLLSHRP